MLNISSHSCAKIFFYSHRNLCKNVSELMFLYGENLMIKQTFHFFRIFFFAPIQTAKGVKIK